MTSSGIGNRKVDIRQPGVSQVLDALAAQVRLEELDGVEERDLEDVPRREVLVKVNPPVWIRVEPSAEVLATHIPSPAPSDIPNGKLDRFMSSWTRLVGDPILSKWIVVFLAISIVLNGYLLKGIAAGVGVGVGLGLGVGKGGVRFDSPDTAGNPTTADGAAYVDNITDSRDVNATWEGGKYGGRDDWGKEEPKKPKIPTFTLEDVDRRLQARRLTVGPDARSPPTPTSLTSRSPNVSFSISANTSISTDVDASTSSSSSPSPVDEKYEKYTGPIRSLAECIEIFENGPRPASVALSLLNDEEIVLLAQNGKIAAYALEKVLGGNELERAVRVRRMLVCEYLDPWSLTKNTY